MLYVPCEDCGDREKCQEKKETHRRAFFAFAESQLVKCSGWIERRWRGLEGVRA